MADRRGAGPLSLLPVVLTAILLLVPLPSALVDRYYSTSLYPAWQQMATATTNAVPGAAFDLVLAGALLLVAAAVVRAWRADRAAGRGRRLLRSGLAAAVALSTVYLWFAAGWGLNYRRTPLTERIAFDRARVTPAATTALAERAVRELNALHADAWARPWPALDELPGLLGPLLPQAARGLRLPEETQPGLPKASLLQFYLRWAAVDGLTNPFVPEIVVNQDLLATEQPFVVAHEWGHLAGLAHEAEAAFFAWRLCQGGTEQTRYSAWLSLYGTVMRGVPGPARQQLAARLARGPRRDLDAIAARYARTVPAVREAAWAGYDRYLKSHAVAEGVASYDAVVALILGTSFAP